MHRIGKLFLLCSRWWHRWHRVHLPVALGLIIVGLASRLGILSGHFSEITQELEPRLGDLTLFFFAIYVVLWGGMSLAARFWSPPVALITALPRPLETPSHSHWIFGDYLGTKFRYRFAQDADLDAFVRFSNEDPAIVNANKQLSPQQRLNLYRKWFLINQQAFLLLERKEISDAVWLPTAASIVLPLSDLGAMDLWEGNVEVIKLDRRHFTRGQTPKAILIDTLAMEQKLKAKIQKDIIFALPQLHAAKLWRIRGRASMLYWIEPDHRALKRTLLRETGFEGPHFISDEHQIFSVVLPPKRPTKLNERQISTLEQLHGNLKQCGGWQVLTES